MVVCLSIEVEFRAMAQGSCEFLWVKIILRDLMIKFQKPMILYCDNRVAIDIAYN